MKNGIIVGIVFCFVAEFVCSAFDEPLYPFLDQHCYSCHDEDVKKGGLDLYSLSTDLTDEAALAKWVRVYDRVVNGEMPPPKKKRPVEDELKKFRRDLAPALAEADDQRKGTVLRRLNRKEYHNTVNDIFGSQVDLISLLPEDGRSHEFDNVGEALGISMIQMQRYLDGINDVLDVSIAQQLEKPEIGVLKADYATSREGEKHIPSAWGRAPDGATVFYKPNGYPTGMLRGTGVRSDGLYKIRIKGYAHQSDKPITMRVGGTSFARGSDKPSYEYFSLKPGQPQVIELTQFIRRKYMISIDPVGLTDLDRYITKNRTTDGYSGPGLAINEVEVIGPIVEEFPSKGHQLIFSGINRQVVMPVRREPTFAVQSNDPAADAAKALRRVATVAFRRPCSAEDVAPFVALFNNELAKENVDFESALRSAVAAIFLSPQFLYLDEKPGLLDDYALASRLSYAFSRTAPDRELLTAAAEGQLKENPEAIWQQTQRLLSGPHFDRFIEDFADAWLNLREIEFTQPDKDLFPEYDSYLHDSAIKETRYYLWSLFADNLPITHMVKSDFAMLNERLAQHYEIPDVIGPELRRVSLPADSVRGGFLGQTSVLKVSANGTNTSPVVRGVWVMERMLGLTPAPPPPGIPGVEPDIRGADTLRELLDKHRSSESCQACHESIDPPGFALESFNPIGGWRENFRSMGEGERLDLEVNGRHVRYRIGPKVDASGQTSTGEKFGGYTEFRDILANDPNRLAKALTKKLLVFTTGREMGFSDRPEINRIVKASAAQGHGVQDLLKLVVQSEIFQNK
ncbi:MAG: DUF1592 domain-containing protein [Verrucomicrobiota bacterium]